MKKILEELLKESTIDDPQELKMEIISGRKMISNYIDDIGVFFTQLNHLQTYADKKDFDTIKNLVTALEKNDAKSIKTLINSLAKREHQWKTLHEAVKRISQTNAAEKMYNIVQWAKSGSGKDISDTL